MVTNEELNRKRLAVVVKINELFLELTALDEQLPLDDEEWVRRLSKGARDYFSTLRERMTPA